MAYRSPHFRSRFNFYFALQAPNFGLHTPHLGLQVPHLALHAPYADDFVVQHFPRQARQPEAHPATAAAVTTAAAKLSESREDRDCIKILREG